MKTTNKKIKEKEERRLSFKQEIEKLRNTADEDEYAKQLAHIFLGNGLSLQTILLMAIDFGQQHPQWIPVEERKPQERGHYLVYSQFGDVWLSEWMQDKEGRWDWYVAPICVGIISKVTHWMPLPEAPRKEE